MKRSIGTAVCLLIFAAASMAAAQTAKHHWAEVGIGFVGASEYADALKDAYSDYDVSGGGAFIDIEGGFAINVAPNVHVTPKLMLLFAPVSFGSEYTGSKKASIFIIPQVQGRYSYKRFFFGGGLGVVQASSDLSRLDFEGNGVSLGLRGGFTFTENLEAELGWQTVPVKVGSGEYGMGGGSEKDFGGFALIIRGLYPIGSGK
jgi:hypothetical protein